MTFMFSVVAGNIFRMLKIQFENYPKQEEASEHLEYTFWTLWLWWFEMFFFYNYIIILSAHFIPLHHIASHRITEFWNENTTHFFWAWQWLFDPKPGIKTKTKIETFLVCNQSQIAPNHRNNFLRLWKERMKKSNRETHKHDKHVTFDVEKQNNRDKISMDMKKIWQMVNSKFDMAKRVPYFINDVKLFPIHSFIHKMKLIWPFLFLLPKF